MKIEKVYAFSSTTGSGDGVIRALVTKTVDGWLITRSTIYGRVRGTKASSASNTIAFVQVNDPSHSIDPEDFFFSNER